MQITINRKPQIRQPEVSRKASCKGTRRKVKWLRRYFALIQGTMYYK